MKEPLGKPVGKPQERSGEISPEIEKLTEKLSKDPKSKLFVPLAEEYLKIGMLDEAVMVLTEGLKHHPGFLTARVALGKIYLQREQPAEARTEFEAVLAANPDNLLAQRRLAQLYLNAGEAERARDCARIVLRENAKDAEMRQVVDAAEQRLQAAAAAARPVELTASATEMPAVESGRAEPEPAAPAPMTAETAPSRDAATSLEEATRAEFRAAEVAPPAAAADPAASIDLAPPIPDPAPAVAAAEPAPPETVELSSAASGSLEEILAELGVPKAGSAEAARAAKEPAAGPVEILSESLADLYVQQGLMDKGIEIYRKLLARQPDRPGLNEKLARAESLAQMLPANAAPAVAPTDPQPGPAAPAEPDAGSEPIELAAELGGPIESAPAAAPAATAPIGALAQDAGGGTGEVGSNLPAPAWEPEPVRESSAAVLAAPGAAESEPAAAAGPAAVGGATDAKSNRRRKIERLQAWLSSIRRGTGG